MSAEKPHVASGIYWMSETHGVRWSPERCRYEAVQKEES